MATVTIEIIPFGGLTVGTVVLANASPGLATVGIKRDSDSFVIVPAETAMTGSGDEYTYSTDLLDPMTDYTAYIRVEYLNESDSSFNHYEQITAAIKGYSSRTTFRALRREIARKIGGYIQATTTETSPNVHSLKSSGLIDRAANTKDLDEGWWYIATGPNAGQQARAMPGGFTIESGIAEIARDLSVATPAGSEIEWLSRMPAVQAGKMAGIRECLNQALEVLWTIDRITSPTADGILTDMNTLDWLRRQSQIISVETMGGSDEYPVSYADAYSWRYDADRPMLIGPSGFTDGPLSIAAYRPLNTWMRRGGTWQEADGFVDDQDESLGDHVLIVQVALFYVYKTLAASPYVGETERNRWETLAERQAVIAKNIKLTMSPQEAQTPGVRYVWEPWSKGLVPLRRI